MLFNGGFKYDKMVPTVELAPSSSKLKPKLHLIVHLRKDVL